jgi:hypothetical protein
MSGGRHEVCSALGSFWYNDFIAEPPSDKDLRMARASKHFESSTTASPHNP